ncbi:ATP-binding protein [Undibacterium sp. SXout7W]|uniref:ATP-binding protein n=1 Tax=Undibacterium sp. SXout7W TaxID=3413049 RepID=UPI003BF3CBDB
MKKLASLLRLQYRFLRDTFLLLLLLAIATFISFVLDHAVSLVSQSMFYVLAVVIASYYLGWGAAIVCALSAVAALNFFFVPPRWTFQVEHTEHLIALATMLVLALVINRLSSGMRRETETARLNERRARQLQRLAIELAEANEPADVVALGKKALTEAFAGEHVILLAGTNGKPAVITMASSTGSNSSAVSDIIRDGLACCMQEVAVIGAGTGRWSELDAWYLPLGESARGVAPAGAVCIQQVSAEDESGREHASALCSILGQALSRLQLRSAMLIARGEAQRQQLQGIFLAAISHDLRTPLAVIVGAASALQLQHDKLHADEQERLLASIASEAAHLSTLTENTLQLVSLSNSSQTLRRDWESMEEIIGTVLARLRQHDPERRIVCRLQDGLPLLKLDPVLIAQLITNLLDNALKYTEQSVYLTVGLSKDDSGQEWMLIAVKDRGAGISEQEQQHIFEPYARGDHADRATQRGSGLGLAVCRAIAQAHQGDLVLRRRSGGGSSFIVSLPVDAAQPVAAEDRL